MKLYEEIILLNYHFNGRWVVENTESYYKPLIKPQKRQRHYFWANFYIDPIKLKASSIKSGSNTEREKMLGIDLSNYNISDKRKILRNCVHPELGKHILECAFKKQQTSLEMI